MTDPTTFASNIAPDGATTLGEFLQALADGPILDAIRVNAGSKSSVRRRYARWLAAQQRAALTKFPATPG
jgi:hypothetical protein